MSARPFEPKSMKLSVLRAALQQLTPRLRAAFDASRAWGEVRPS